MGAVSLSYLCFLTLFPVVALFKHLLIGGVVDENEDEAIRELPIRL